MNLHKPLATKELTELQEFLLSDTTPKKCMDIESLDGFLTAIVSGPEVVMPSEWLPVVWGDKEGPVFETEAQANKIINYMMRHMNEISAVLMKRPQEYEPLIYEWESKDDFHLKALGWSNGYLNGVDLRKHQWQPLLGDDDYAEMFMPILTLISKVDDPDCGELVNTSEKRQRFIDMIPEAVVNIHHFWLERRMPITSKPGKIVPFKKPEKIGRNEPCPCGSGKKYKKCCGSSEKLN